MVTLIQTTSGTCFYTNATPEQIHGQIEMGNAIDVWWFAPWGQRYSERLLLSMDRVEFLRTESDDG